jgi:hypothetical protein
MSIASQWSVQMVEKGVGNQMARLYVIRQHPTIHAKQKFSSTASSLFFLIYSNDDFPLFLWFPPAQTQYNTYVNGEWGQESCT